MLKPHSFDGYRHNNNCNFGGVKLITNSIPDINFSVITDHGPFCYRTECPLLNRHFYNPENGSSMLFYALSNYFTFNITMIVKKEGCVGIVNVCGMCGTNYLRKMDLDSKAPNQIYQTYTSKSFTILCDYFHNFTIFGEIHIVPIFGKCFVLQTLPRTEVRVCSVKVPGVHEEFQGKYNIALKFDEPKLDIIKQTCFKYLRGSAFNATVPHYQTEQQKIPIPVLKSTGVLNFLVGSMTIFKMTYCRYYDFVYTMRVSFPYETTNVCPVYEPKSLPHHVSNNKALCYMLVCERDGIAGVLTKTLHSIRHTPRFEFYVSYIYFTEYTMFDKANLLLKFNCSGDDNPFDLVQLHIFVLRRGSSVIVQHLILLSNISYATYTFYHEMFTILIDKPKNSCTVEAYFEFSTDVIRDDVIAPRSLRFKVNMHVSEWSLFVKKLLYENGFEDVWETNAKCVNHSCPFNSLSRV